MNKKALLFDFDGVLVNSFELAFSISKKFDPDLTRDLYRSFFNGNIYENGASHDPKEEKVADDDYWFDDYKTGLLELEPIPGMVDLIKSIGNDYWLAVVTSSINSPVQAYLEKHELSRYFDDIMGADIHKSKVRKIQMALKKYDLEPQDALFITDTLGDMREADKAAVESIGVTWGFHDADHLSRGAPMALVHSPQELLAEIPGAFFRLSS